MCSYRGGEGGSQETYSVRLKKVSEIYGRPLKLYITSIQVPMPAVQFVGFVVLNNSTALRSLATVQLQVGTSLPVMTMRWCTPSHKSMLLMVGGTKCTSCTLNHAKYLSSTLDACKRIRYFGLVGFPLDSCAVTQLLALVAALDSLKLGPLYLEKIGLTTQHTSAVNHLLQQQHTRLQGISLFGNPLTTTFLEGVSDSLRQCSRLEHVHFGDCGLSSACLPVLAPLLRHWPRLQKLWLSNNDFRDLPDDADQFLDSVIRAGLCRNWNFRPRA